MKVLHVPANVAGNPQGLALAERELGLDSRVVTLQPPPFGMKADEVLWPAGASMPARLARQIGLIRRAARDVDIVHYNNGKTIAALPLPAAGRPMAKRLAFGLYSAYARLLQRWELSMLRRAGRPWFVTYQGSDARQPDYCLAHFDTTFYREPEAAPLLGLGAHVREQIGRITAGAARVYALNPDLLHVLPEGSEFLPYASVDLSQWRPAWQDASRPLIVHAPSQRWVKGTRYILEAVERLRAEGAEFDFELIENMPHEEARRRYERAHLLVDQLLAGWYGGLAVELMALGKPVASYVRAEDLGFIPQAMRAQLPVIDARPDTIHAVLKDWLQRPLPEWRERGLAGRRYVEAWHDPLKIAARLKRDYEAALARRETA